MPDIMEGRIQPGRVFNLVTTLAKGPEGYRTMKACEAIMVLIEVR